MPAKKNDRFITSIELGTHFIKVLIAKELPQGQVEIIGSGTAPSLKVQKGEITEPKLVTEQLDIAITNAENQANVDILDTFIALAVSGSYITTYNRETEHNISNDGRAITEDQFVQAIRIARNLDSPKQTRVLETSNRFFTLADNRQTLNPCGLFSPTLRVSLLVVQAIENRLKTPIELLELLLGQGIQTCCYVPTALGRACLDIESVKQHGRLIIDVGAGVTSYAVFTTAGCHTAGQITVGFEHIANDVSIAFSIPIKHAQNILLKFRELNCSIREDKPQDLRLIDVDRGPGTTSVRIPVASVELVVKLRLMELFNIIKQELDKADAWRWIQGDILLSGGTALMPGIQELLQSCMNSPVSIAKPNNKIVAPKEIADNPAFIVTMGALLDAKAALDIFDSSNTQTNGSPSGIKSLWDGIKTIINF